MIRWLGRIAMVVLVAVAGLVTVFLVGMRTKSPAVVDRVRRINRGFTNPKVMASAGSPGASASVMRHTGRRSGNQYETPIGPFPIDDGFVVALPYGPSADWASNVLAGGPATLLHEGVTHTVTDPVVVATAEVVADLPQSEQRVLKLFGVTECLRFRAAPAAAVAE